jgi:hypothetical protein
MMADWNKDEADGTARRALIMFAPLLWPASVILAGDPPKLDVTFCRNWSAVTMSLSPRLVDPSGPRKPS